MNKFLYSNKSLLLILFFASILTCQAQSETKTDLRKVNWVFYQKAFDIAIKEEKIPKEVKKESEIERPKDKAYEVIYKPPAEKTLEERHSSTVTRIASNEKERLLIRKAEALYPNEFSSAEAFAKLASTLKNPYWVYDSFDGVNIPKTVTTEAIQYYQKLSQDFRDNKKVTNINMLETNLTYTGSVKHYEHYTINNEQFNDIDVASLELGWYQSCGMLCSMGFVRNKVVIFNNIGEPVAVFVDKSLNYVIS